MRLTKKDLMNAINQPMCFGSRLVGKKMFAQIIKEHCEYKDIEDELGIDLITLFKALKNGVYVKEANGKIKYYNPNQIAVNWVGNYPEIAFLNTAKKGDYCALNTKAYKLPYTPTWALTKEELL